MSKIYKWYNRLSKQKKDSIIISMTVMGLISTILSIIGISLGNIEKLNILSRIVIVILAFSVMYIGVYIIIGNIFKKSINIIIQQTPVSITCGNIFETPELRVIGCDTHFDTRVDDIIISKKSLHGQLVLKYGKKDEINNAIEVEANRLGLRKNRDGFYDFPLGTIIRYNSSIDNHIYLMLAMTKLNNHNEAHTNMSEFEYMLMKMWKEIDRVYASNDIAVPLLGTGISRFDDGLKGKESLLRCMLCTLNNSGVSFNSKVKILIYDNIDDIPLYEYKNIFHLISGR
ncbi:DUF6430 domain-containing protein [Fusobacterium simiae]|uniref:DUF6430 domain-containing protein n=1 Tax=Fusobacterium simiae TaxID=855 RepID=A0ABT4DF81_FUSSI|nr:macro domain-containing protein [Fusobacterium simiae]MCY7007256.1 DUF6430 domain-containing protein [Fusobacterium simiae]